MCLNSPVLCYIIETLFWMKQTPSSVLQEYQLKMSDKWLTICDKNNNTSGLTEKVKMLA